MMEQNQRRICKKCFLKDFAPEEYLTNMRAYLAGLEDEIRTEEKTYQSRLSQCEKCDKLAEGICRVCGCFVEYRAAIRLKTCPDIHPKW